MFRDFSFAPASPPDYFVYEAERAAMNVSPTSKATEAVSPFSRPPTPPCTIGDLAAKLNQQSLRINTQVACIASGPPTPPSDEGASPTQDPSQDRPTYSRVAASLVRMQRQNNSRMQCSSTHVRDLSKLVRMIEEEAQCTVSDVSSRTSSTSSMSSTSSASYCILPASGEDEGVDMDFDNSTQKTKALAGTQTSRFAERHDSGIRVARPVRMRKRPTHNGVSKRR